MFRWNLNTLKSVPVKISKAVSQDVPQEKIMKMLSDADEARKRRKVDVTNEQTYMIRFIVPPDNKKVAVVFLRIEEEMRAVMLYNEELKDFLDETGHDFKQLSGNPLDGQEG